MLCRDGNGVNVIVLLSSLTVIIPGKVLSSYFSVKESAVIVEGRIGSLNVVIIGEFIRTPEEPLAGLILITSGGTESAETIPSFAIAFSAGFSEALVPK